MIGRDEIATIACRTWCPDLRLSEDIDLLVDTPKTTEDLILHVSRALRREFPEHSWEKLGSRHQVDTRSLSASKSTVQVQFVQWRHAWKGIPRTLTPVLLRYSDLPTAVRMSVLAASGFVPSPESLEAGGTRTLERDWQSELAHQIGAARSPNECLDIVRASLREANDSDP